MDESMRPSRAEKRRSAHGEKPLFPNDTNDTISVHTDTDTAGEFSLANDDSDKENSNKRRKLATKTKKRSPVKLQAHVSPRRSSRQVSRPEAAYRTDIHPQDDHLQETSDMEEVSPEPSPKTTNSSPMFKKTVVSPSELDSDGAAISLGSDGNDFMEDEPGDGTVSSDGKSIPITPQNTAGHELNELERRED
jgi:hypothetical protein